MTLEDLNTDQRRERCLELLRERGYASRAELVRLLQAEKTKTVDNLLYSLTRLGEIDRTEHPGTGDVVLHIAGVAPAFAQASPPAPSDGEPAAAAEEEGDDRCPVCGESAADHTRESPCWAELEKRCTASVARMMQRTGQSDTSAPGKLCVRRVGITSDGCLMIWTDTGDQLELDGAGTHDAFALLRDNVGRLRRNA
jgi:hypothetical protein